METEFYGADVVQELLASLAAELPEVERPVIEQRLQLIELLLTPDSDFSAEKFLSDQVAGALGD